MVHQLNHGDHWRQDRGGAKLQNLAAHAHGALAHAIQKPRELKVA
jgi:hypothetical protein